MSNVFRMMSVHLCEGQCTLTNLCIIRILSTIIKILYRKKNVSSKIEDLLSNCELYISPTADCGNGLSIEHGHVVHSTTTFGSVAVFHCDSGYQIQGHNQTTCLANASWSYFANSCRTTGKRKTVLLI